ncbi:MAG: succinyl-CoA synthetase subunit alpha [Syntrophorhabdus sp. PtaB.Bin047]|nr:MAG: succinyl-CoA synthetase subunit alpha [Syntrophorhabdus sp. PtaB.Bin047]
MLWSAVVSGTTDCPTDRDQKGRSMNDRKSPSVYDALFRPQSIAIVGGSENLAKPGGKVLANIVDHHYRGTLWVVNPGGSVKGLPTFASVPDLPGPPELGIIAIPATLVAGALEDLGRKGTRAVVILSAGFGEKDEKGREEEKRLLAIAGNHGMTIIGPNCSGFMTSHYSGKFAGIIPELKPRSIDFISGSGATVDLVMEQAVLRGLAFCNVVNVGNSIQTGVEDLIALYDENYDVEGSPILMLYLESLRKPGLLLRHARSLTQKGCAIVGIKSGVSVSGARAAASHTGAMATDDAAVEALFNKAGIIRVKSKMEMIDVACALQGTGGRLKGNRACVITDAGGPGVMLTDELERQGFVLPILGERTRRRLHGILPSESSVMNPIDCLPSRTASQIREVFEVLAEEERAGIDVIAIQVGNPGMYPNREIYREVARAMKACPIPVIPTLSSVTTCTEPIAEFTGDGNFCFTDEVNLGSALGKVLHRREILEPAGEIDNYDPARIGNALKGCTGVLPAGIVKEVLEGAGFVFPPQAEAVSLEEMKEACGRMGYPLAMKVLGPLHKSDLGGVKLGITDAAAAERAWHDLTGIKDARGALIQPMVEGTEVILGASRAGDLGHLIMFGLGGIYTEVLRDVTFALAPLAGEECRGMVKGIRSYPILEGVRGQRQLSVERLADHLERLGRLVSDFPVIGEIDINPLKGSGSELCVVDARIVLHAATRP